MDREIGIIQRALKRAELANRNEMRAKLYFKERIPNACDYLEILTAQLKQSPRDFILKFRCVLTQNMVGKVSTFGCRVGDILRLTRTNGSCAMNGYREQWLYPCVCNK